MLSLRIAWRFLRSSPVQSGLIIGGIAVGIAVQIFVGSLITSLQASLVDQTIGSAPQITISAIEDGDPVVYSDRMKEVIAARAADHSRHGGACPRRHCAVHRGQRLGAAQPDRRHLGRARRHLQDHRAHHRGRALAALGRDHDRHRLRQEVRYRARRHDPTRDPGRRSGAAHGLGHLRPGLGGVQRAPGVRERQRARERARAGRAPSTARSRCSSRSRSPRPRSLRRCGRKLPGVEVAEWQAQNADLLVALQSQGSSSYIIQTFVLVAIALGIASTLAIAAVQKTRQIGILKAMGLSDSRSGRIFLLQALDPGGTGSLSGVALAYFLLFGFSFSGASFSIQPQPAFVLGSAAIGMGVALAARASSPHGERASSTRSR